MTRVLKRARTLSLASSQSCYSPQGLAARSYVVNRLDTDLTTKLARCLKRRDDNRPTLSMTGTHAITNRRHKTLCVKRYFQFLPLASPHALTTHTTTTTTTTTILHLPTRHLGAQVLVKMCAWTQSCIRWSLSAVSLKKASKIYKVKPVHFGKALHQIPYPVRIRVIRHLHVLPSAHQMTLSDQQQGLYSLQLKSPWLDSNFTDIWLGKRKSHLIGPRLVIG